MNNTTNPTNKDRLEGPILLSKGYGNSFKWIWQLKGVKHGPKALVGYLCSYMGAGNTAFPSRKKICYDLEINRGTLGKWLKVLTEDTTILQVEQVRNDNGQFSHNIYHLNFNPEIICPRLKILNEESAGSPQKSASAPWPKKPATVKPAPVKPATNNNKDPFNNNKEKQQQKDEQVPADPSTPAEEQKPEKEPVVVLSATQEEPKAETDGQAQALEMLQGINIPAETGLQLLELKRPEEIMKIIETAKADGSITNPAGFVRRAIEKAWTLPELQKRYDMGKEKTNALLAELSAAELTSEAPEPGLFKKLKNICRAQRLELQRE